MLEEQSRKRKDGDAARGAPGPVRDAGVKRSRF